MKRFILFSIVLIIGFAISCGEKSNNQNNTSQYGSIPVKLVFPDDSMNISPLQGGQFITGALKDMTPEHLDILVTGNGMADFRFNNILFSAHSCNLTGIPAGNDRTITIEVQNAIHETLYTGSASGINVPAGGAAPTQTIVLEAVDRGDWFVDDDAPVGGDGKSWATAFRTIQDAVNLALAGDNIFVAEGTYISAGGTMPVLLMISNVAIYGGFKGTEIYLSERADLAVPPSTLPTSTLDGQDTSTHVVVGASNAILNGFTISNGNAEVFNATNFIAYHGGGMYNDHVTSLLVEKCVFKDNNAYNGAGMANVNYSIVTVIDSSFINNRTTNDLMRTPTPLGAGIINLFSSILLSNCEFNDNAYWGLYNYNAACAISNCEFSYNDGSGIMNSSSSGTISNCRFIGNSSSGMHNISSLLTIVNCLFTGNFSLYGGGMWNEDSSPTIYNCTFTGNASYSGGGAMANMEKYMEFVGLSAPVITNSIFWQNHAPTNPEIYISPNTPNTVTITYSDFEGGHTGTGNINASPQFVVSSTLSGNWTSNSVYNSSPYYQTTFTDSSKAWATSSLRERFLSLGTQQYFIIDNTATTIMIWGDYPSIIGTAYQVIEYSGLHIGSTSPCKDAGTATGAPANDLDGYLRPYNSLFDMGAYEYHP